MALLTQAEAERSVPAADVALFTGSDADVIAELLDEASDFVQEYATAAGHTLVAGSLTKSTRRRIAVVFIYYAACRYKKARNAQGKAPYHDEYETVVQELKDWSKRLRPLSTDTPHEGPTVLSDTARGWTGSEDTD